MGRLPGFLFTRAKNDRKESSLWKRDLSFLLSFSVIFFSLLPFHLIVDFSRLETRLVRIPEENFFLRDDDSSIRSRERYLYLISIKLISSKPVIKVFVRLYALKKPFLEQTRIKVTMNWMTQGLKKPFCKFSLRVS